MRRGRRTAAIGLACMMIAGGLAGVDRSADASQASSTPAIVDCTVAPLPSPVWDGIELADPTAPVSIDGPFVPPTGEPADEATLAAVSDTLGESIACQNDGDLTRTLALFTPDGVRAFFSGPRGYDAVDVEATIVAGPVPVDEEQAITLVSIEDVLLLEDGRVGALVTTAAGATEYIDFVFLEQGTTVDGGTRWLIDSSVAVDAQTQVEGGATEIP